MITKTKLSDMPDQEKMGKLNKERCQTSTTSNSII